MAVKTWTISTYNARKCVGDKWSVMIVLLGKCHGKYFEYQKDIKYQIFRIATSFKKQTKKIRFWLSVFSYFLGISLKFNPHNEWFDENKRFFFSINFLVFLFIKKCHFRIHIMSIISLLIHRLLLTKLKKNKQRVWFHYSLFLKSKINSKPVS